MNTTAHRLFTRRYATYVAVGFCLAIVLGFELWKSTLKVDVKDIDLGTIDCGENYAFTTVINNDTYAEFRIVGVHCCCGVSVTEYPSVVKARSSVKIPGSLGAPSKSGAFERQLVVYGEQDGLRRVPFVIKGVATQSEKFSSRN